MSGHVLGPLLALGDEPEWTLVVGWADGSLYHLTLRPSKEGEQNEDKGPWVLYARPRRVGGREIWSLWSEPPETPETLFSFVRVEAATGRLLRLSELGHGGSSGGRLDVASSTELAQILSDTKQTVVESQVTCRR